MTEDFPRILSRLRKERRLNQRTAAAALHISQALLSHYENGLREPGLSFVDAACSYYGVSADYLLGRTASQSRSIGIDGAYLSLARSAERRKLDPKDMEILMDAVAKMRDGEA